MPPAIAQNLPQILTSSALMVLLVCVGLALLFGHPRMIRMVRRDGPALIVAVSSYVVAAMLLSLTAGIALQAALQG